MESRNAWFNISPEVMMTSFRANPLKRVVIAATLERDSVRHVQYL